MWSDAPRPTPGAELDAELDAELASFAALTHPEETS
jgi:hypothetical protein